MPNRISIATATDKLTAGYRKAVEEAAGNGFLNPLEQSRMGSELVKRTLPDERLSVDAAVDLLEPKIRRALYAVSADKKTITRDDVKKLRATELRTATESLFGPGSKLARLEKALAALDVPQLTDYGTSIGVSKPVGRTLAAVMENITGNEFDMTYGWDEVKGARAVTAFASHLRGIGAEEKKRVEEDPDGKDLGGQEIYDRFSAAATAAGPAFRPTTDFKSLHFLSHSIQEDGDMEYAILLGQKKDSSWVALTYSNFPF